VTKELTIGWTYIHKVIADKLQTVAIVGNGDLF